MQMILFWLFWYIDDGNKRLLHRMDVGWRKEREPRTIPPSFSDAQLRPGTVPGLGRFAFCQAGSHLKAPTRK